MARVSHSSARQHSVFARNRIDTFDYAYTFVCIFLPFQSVRHRAYPPVTPPSPPPHERLFREEAVESQRVQHLGQIVLTPRISTLWLSLVAGALAVAVVAFLLLGSHTRRVTVTGQLMPAGGLMRVHTPQVGVVLEKRVAEGQSVKKGDVLYVLSSDRAGMGTRELQANIARQVNERKSSLELEVLRSQQALAEELASIQRRTEALRAERQALAAQMGQQRTRLSLAIDTQRRYKGLADQDYIAGEELRQKEIDVTEQRSRLQGLERETLGVQRSLTQMEQEGNDTRLRFDNQIAQLRREISNTDQELTEVESRRRVVITAPEAGRATLVAAEVGQTADSVQPLVTLVPESARLQARLYAPSSSIGFVQAGDTVLLRYAAFPYQKFGLQQGVVESVSTSALRPSEMAEVSSVGGTPDTPLFAIQVRLNSTHIEANGQARPLQAGMQLEADILQERRKLYEWMLEPLYSLTRRQAS